MYRQIQIKRGSAGLVISREDGVQRTAGVYRREDKNLTLLLYLFYTDGNLWLFYSHNPMTAETTWKNRSVMAGVEPAILH